MEDNEPTKLRITSDEPLNMPMTFDSSAGNIYYKLEFQTPNKNVNIKLQVFKYTGSTEAGCYLGGIVFSSSKKCVIKYGPFCGELGQNILSGKGLSLGLLPVTMILYLIADRIHSQAMSFELSVKNEPCIATENPCKTMTSPKTVKWQGWQVWVGAMRQEESHTIQRTYDGNFFINLYNTQRHVGICYHIQHFMQTYQDEACVIRVVFLYMEKTLQATVNMYYERYQAQRCSNCTKSYTVKPR